jgi:nuclear pore complex protein Nup93
VLEDRSRREWEARKKRVFDELGGRLGGDTGASVLGTRAIQSRSALTVRGFASIQGLVDPFSV